jgi:hypothetical protein
MAVRSKIAVLAAATSLFAAGLAGVGAASASAATAKLTITPTGYGGYYNVSVAGNVAGLYPQGFDVVVRLWGSDWQFDDLIAGPFTNYGAAYQPGYGREFQLHRSQLNEDPEGRDEIYAGVRIYDRRNGRQTEVVESNMVYDYY